MKRYLITGALAFALCTLFNSCKETTEFDGNNIVEAKMDAFDKMFVETYGEIAPGHDWGFGPTSAARTRTANPNGNEWGNKYVVPGPITDQELIDVLAVFNQPGAASYTSLIDLSTFFVQQVYKGVATYTDSAGNTGVLGSEKMNWLYAIVNGKGDHINNFNRGDNKDYDGIMLMVESSTEAFGFSNSNGQGRLFPNFRMEEINGNYYVGFDFESWRASEANGNEGVKRDYIYNDWIVKIVPAVDKNTDSNTPQVMVVNSQTLNTSTYKVYKSTKVTDIGRVMAEDLGSSNKNDMDYNDVVFDARIIKDFYEVEVTINNVTVTQTSGSYTVNNTTYTAGYTNPRANIKLLAAGGTIPIQVAGVPVHDAFGNVAKTTMINTYNPEMTNGMYVTLAPVDLINPENGAETKYDFDYTDIVDIPIAAEYSNGVIEIDNTGEVPHKIRVPVSAPWPIERVEMNTAYNNTFGHGLLGSTGGGYVQNKDVKFWESAVSGKVKYLEGFNSSIGDVVIDRAFVTQEEKAGSTNYVTVLQNADNKALGAKGNDWTTVWTRSDDDPGYLYTDATSHIVSVSNNQFNSVNVGTKVRIYGVSKTDWSVTTNIDNETKRSYSNAEEGYIEFTLTDESIKTDGLTISGDKFTVVRVDILPATEQEATIPARRGTVIWPESGEGNTIVDWDNTTVYLTKEYLAAKGVTENSVIRFYGIGLAAEWQMKVNANWTGLDVTGWSADDAGVHAYQTYWGHNNETNKGYEFEMTVTSAIAEQILESGLRVSGNQFKLMYISVQNPSEDNVLWSSNSGNSYNSQDLISVEALIAAGMTKSEGGILTLIGTRGQWYWQVFVKDGNYNEIIRSLESNNGNNANESFGHWDDSDWSHTSSGYVSIPYSADDAKVFLSSGMRIEYGGITLTTIKLE